MCCDVFMNVKNDKQDVVPSAPANYHFTRGYFSDQESIKNYQCRC